MRSSSPSPGRDQVRSLERVSVSRTAGAMSKPAGKPLDSNDRQAGAPVATGVVLVDADGHRIGGCADDGAGRDDGTLARPVEVADLRLERAERAVFAED